METISKQDRTISVASEGEPIFAGLSKKMRGEKYLLRNNTLLLSSISVLDFLIPVAFDPYGFGKMTQIIKNK